MKKILFVILFLSVILIPTFHIYAKEELSLDTIYEDLPDDIKKYAVDDFDISTVLGDVLKNGINFSLKTFGTVVIFCLISIYFKTLTMKNNENSYVISFISTYACSVSIYSLIFSQIDVISVFAERLSQLMGGFLLFSNAVFMFCGYVTTAATSSAWLQLIMNLISSGVARYQIPLLKVLCGISLADQTICRGKLTSFYNLCKNTYLWIGSIIITLISTVMSLQTSISKISDIASVQSIKFAATQAFPIVGGLVGATTDIISYFLSPQIYAINPVVTVGAASMGLVSGLLAKYVFSKKGYARLIFPSLIAHLLGSMIIKSIGLYQFYGVAVLWRVPLYLVIAPLEIFVLCLMYRHHVVQRLFDGGFSQ